MHYRRNTHDQDIKKRNRNRRLALAAQEGAQVAFYEQDGFHGRSFATDRQVADFDRIG